MTAWNYRVPPNITVTVKARNRPTLLSRCLGEETPVGDSSSFALDLAARSERTGRGPLSLEPASSALTVRGVYKAIPWSCRILRRDDGGWTAEFSSPLLREYLALHVVLLPALRRLLLESGVGLIAGAAFEREGAATILAGLTGHGKTTALLGAVERGASLIGDEYLGLSESAGVTPVVRAIALRRATLALAPRTLRRLRPNRRIALRAARIASLVTKGRLEPLIHVSPSELGARAAGTPSRVERLFWLEMGGAMGPRVRCEPIDAGEAVDHLATIQAVHDLAYGDMGAFLDPAGAGYAMRWRETIERGLRRVSCYRMAVPASRDAASEMLEHLLGPAEPGQSSLAGG